ncbi:riboflavin synthase subunit alpha [Candidatus Methylospira mobilis]|uniref:riboflavin synthase subunit alpha n=1 Tax=Candidatus Methylospira mobilis TaxID=1808979 RepID=UPI0028E66B78|nr:riboflavin synthase subunit alpha [Candidatus Methylospira mobilis]WNV03801.1 riboflavin synthase subunit alpha [Candidatus Methylospira mobilis]
MLRKPVYSKFHVFNGLTLNYYGALLRQYSTARMNVRRALFAFERIFMFTGIVQGIATIKSVTDIDGMRSFEIEFPSGFCTDLKIGASIAIDGVCLTVTEVLSDIHVKFDVMLQSTLITTLGGCTAGDRVNAERAAKDGAEIGGHPLSGHVDFCATVHDVKQIQNNYCIRIGVPHQWMRYIFPKGYIALNGTSLTISEINKESDWFEVWLIPETRRMTTFESKLAGSQLNVEIERGTQVVL